MPFQPGNKFGTGGVPKLPEELRGVQMLRSGVVHRVLAKYARMDVSALREARMDPALSALDKAWIAQLLLAADGDGKALDRFMEWAVGAPTAPVEEKTDTQIALDNMTTAELLDVVRKSLPAAKDLPDAPSGEKDV